MAEYVFDTEPLIAFFYEEDGHEVVADILNDIEASGVDGTLAEVNSPTVTSDRRRRTVES
jgi:PIN domain nuclease of toxin-antitoxin system